MYDLKTKLFLKKFIPSYCYLETIFKNKVN